MHWKLLKNDLKNNILQSFNIAFFILLSLAFLSAAGGLAVDLQSAIQRLFTQAKTPHLLQMHSGEVDFARMEAFVQGQPSIEDYQVQGFVNVDNHLLSLGERNLKDVVYDNGFSTQSPRFDFLFDLEGNLLVPAEGEVYVPLYYYSAGFAKAGESLHIGDLSLQIAGFVRDSQMNSSLSASRRFVVHPSDYARIAELGSMEYLIAFRLQDTRQTASVQSAYTAAGLESDGPPFMSYALFQLVNAFSDGISIVALLFIAGLILGISLLCIRFSLLAKLEEDYKELAVLKAIGLPLREIQRLFLSKYLWISGLSCILGLGLGFGIRQSLLSNIKLFFGQPETNFLSLCIPLFLGLLLFALLTLYMRKLSKRLKNLSLNPAQVQEKESKTWRLNKLPLALQMALSDLFGRKKVYRSMFFVLLLALFVLLTPMSIYQTLAHKDFVKYLGLGSYDLRFDLSQLEGKEAEIAALENKLATDERIEKYEIYHSKWVEQRTETGSTQNIWMEFGNPESFPVQYIAGRAATAANEISLSQLLSESLEKKLGDSLHLRLGEDFEELHIVGIFSDITNGGKTAKSPRNSGGEHILWSIIPLSLADKQSSAAVLADYQATFPFAKIADMQSYLAQTFGGTIALLGRISTISFVASLLLLFLIALLFMRMLFLQDRGQIALLKAMGFGNRFIYLQYQYKTALLVGLSLLLGNLLSLTLGDSLGRTLFASMGIHGLLFQRDLLFHLLLVPLAMLAVGYLATHFGLAGLRKLPLPELIKEEIA